MLDAGYKVNVIPGSATAYVDGRVLPGGEDEFRTTLDQLTGARRDVGVPPPRGAAPGPGGLGRRTRRCGPPSSEFDPGGHVVPYCMSGGTDAKQFSRLGITGYGFSPLRLPRGLRLPASSTAWTSGCRSRRCTSVSGCSTGSCDGPELSDSADAGRTAPGRPPSTPAMAAAHDGRPEWPRTSSATRSGGPSRGPPRAAGARWSAGGPTAHGESVLPAPWNVRSRVHRVRRPALGCVTARRHRWSSSSTSPTSGSTRSTEGGTPRPLTPGRTSPSGGGCAGPACAAPGGR